MPEKRYEAMKAGLAKQGITVYQAKGEEARYLIEGLGAEANYDHKYIMHLGEVPSASAMFEETIHATQAKIYGELPGFDNAELCACEVAANRMLLKHSKEYGFDEIDVDDIRKNLSRWEKEFMKEVGVPYEESDYKREI